MKFNSQICTTRSQSERLLALGIKRETADMSYNMLKEIALSLPYTKVVLAMERSGGSRWSQFYSPAWSLHRLLEMCTIGMRVPSMRLYVKDVYDNVIDYIEELIRLKSFNKEYLEE